MKKIAVVGLVCQLLLIGFVSLLLLNQMVLNNWQFHNKDRLSLLMADEIAQTELTEQRQFLESLAQTYQVSVAKYLWQDQETLIIYTTDQSLQGRLQLKASAQGSSARGSLFSNQDFIWDDPKISIEVRPFREVEETGIVGIYYIDSLPPPIRSVFLEELTAELGNVTYEVVEEYHYRLVDILLDQSLWLVAFSLLLLVNLLSYWQFLLQQTKKIAILNLFGYKGLACFWQTSRSLVYLGLVLVISLLTSVTSYFMVTRGGFYAFWLYSFSLISGYLLLVISYLVLFFLCWRQHSQGFMAERIKDKNNLTLGFWVNQGSKGLLLASLLFLLVDGIHESKELQQEIERQAEWLRTENVYRTNLRLITRDPEVYRPFEVRLKDFYLEALPKGIFLIDASNYHKLSNDEYLYDMNNRSGTELERLTSPAGMSVTINENYLKRNPILKADGQLVSNEDLIYKEEVWNVLVPEVLKEYQFELEKRFLEQFDFQKYLFTEAENQQQGLSLNLIYVKNQQGYFTYDSAIDRLDFTIIDPTAVVDTGNLDPAFYTSWLTSSVFVYSPDENGYRYILPEVMATNTLPSIQSTTSIYDARGAQIKEKTDQLRSLTLVLSLMGGTILYTSYGSLKGYLAINRYRFMIKYLFGYPYFELLWKFIMSQLGLIIVIGAVVWCVTQSLIIMPFLLLLILSEWLIYGCLVSRLTSNDSISNFSKLGGQND
ncbi:DUF1430 domain-containing protein [Vagococcus salmoninarum]|uniref:DUF1430 domain-containing protein n=1 Tax=Vagococcus salmoninarum TaxID=2739 RepID=UPI003F9481D0